MRTLRYGLLIIAPLLVATGVARGADVYGLKAGTPDLKSAGPMAFGPEGILFIGDAKGAAVFAVRSGDKSGDPSKVKINIENLPGKLAEVFGVDAKEIQINDMVANPFSGNVYLSLSAGAKTPAAVAFVDGAGKVSRLNLDSIDFAKATIADPPEDKTVGEGPRQRNNRNDSITDLTYIDGKVLISGVATAKATSSVHSIGFPFSDKDASSSLEIYHGAHGRLEDNAPIRTFVPFTIDGEPHVLAGFVCTPLVKFPLKSVSAGEKIRGTTLAELGNRNRPLDMIAYRKDGKSFLLMANSARGVMKISTDDIARNEGITSQISGTAGQAYETIASLTGVTQLDRLNEEHAVVMTQVEGTPAALKTVPLP